MKTKLAMLMILFTSLAVRATELLTRLPRPEDMTDGERIIDLLRALVFLTFLTPIGWAVIIALIIAFIRWMAKSAKTLATTDYSRIPETEKRDRLLDELEKGLK